MSDRIRWHLTIARNRLQSAADEARKVAHPDAETIAMTAALIGRIVAKEAAQ